MQHKYHQLKLLEVELRQEAAGPPLPGMFLQNNVKNKIFYCTNRTLNESNRSEKTSYANLVIIYVTFTLVIL